LSLSGVAGAVSVWECSWCGGGCGPGWNANGSNRVGSAMEDSIVGNHSVGLDDSSSIDSDSGLVRSLQQKRSVRVALNTVNSKIDTCCDRRLTKRVSGTEREFRSQTGDSGEDGNLAQEVRECIDSFHDVSSKELLGRIDLETKRQTCQSEVSSSRG